MTLQEATPSIDAGKSILIFCISMQGDCSPLVQFSCQQATELNDKTALVVADHPSVIMAFHSATNIMLSLESEITWGK